MVNLRERKPLAKKRSTVEKTTIRCPKSHIQFFKQSIDFHLFSKLQFRVRANMICEFEMELTVHVHNYLEKKFDLTKRFQQKQELLDEFGLISERKISEWTTNKIDREYFCAKLRKKKDQFNNGRLIKGLCFLKIRFRKIEDIL
jgi:hypothetical protein